MVRQSTQSKRARRVVRLLILGSILVSCQVGLRASGILAGQASVGPLEPVQLEGQAAPTPAPEVFTTRGLLLFTVPGGRQVAEVAFGPDGRYQIALPAGVYRVELAPNGIDRADELPAEVEIAAGLTTRLDVTIDTGVR